MATKEKPALIIALAKKHVADKLGSKEKDTDVIAEDIMKAIKSGSSKALASALSAFVSVGAGSSDE